MEGKVSMLLHLLALLLCLTAFGLSISAQRRRTLGLLRKDYNTGRTYCIYPPNASVGYGVGAFVLLLASQILIMVATKCLCCGSPLNPGSSRTWTKIFFTASWLTCIVAEGCLIVGAKNNSHHIVRQPIIISSDYGQEISCGVLGNGIFIFGAVFMAFTAIFDILYYIFFKKATASANRFNFPTGTIDKSSISLVPGP